MVAAAWGRFGVSISGRLTPPAVGVRLPARGWLIGRRLVVDHLFVGTAPGRPPPLLIECLLPMLLTLTASSLRSVLLPGRGKKPKMDLLDLPTFARENLGLAGINLSTDLLVGADRSRLESVRERADRASCACLLLVETEVQPFAGEKTGQGAVDRMLRVVEAAHIL